MKNTTTNQTVRNGRTSWLLLRKAALISSALFLGSFTAGAQNLINNASFEQARAAAPTTPPVGSFITLTTSPTALPNWSVPTGPFIDWHDQAHGGMGCPPAPGGGQRHIDLNATGGIEQGGITLLPSTTYNFSYYSSIHSGFAGTAGVANARIEILDGVSLTLFSDFPSKTAADVGSWVQSTFTFTTPATLTNPVTIKAQGIGATVYSNGGVLVDSFVLDQGCGIDFSMCRNFNTRNMIELSIITSPPGATYDVDFGDGAGWQSYTPTYTYGTAGSYKVCIRERVRNVFTCERCMEVCINEIDVHPFMGAKKQTKVNEVQGKHFNVSLAPNPAATNVTLEINVPAATTASISVTDITGKLVLAPVNTQLSAGTNKTTLDIQQIPSGMYTVKVTMDGNTVNQKLSVVR